MDSSSNSKAPMDSAPLRTLTLVPPALALVVMASWPLLAPAMSQPPDGLFELSMEELLDVKITSSTLHDESLKTVPSSMTVFTRADIRRLGLRNLRQLTYLVPGYQGSRVDDSVLSYPVSSRGRRVGGSGSEVLVLIDGQRLNNDWAGGAGQHTQLISIENVERVEMIRGPGSALYGSNAMMGVINIVTRSERELVVETGSHQHRHASAQWRAENEIGKLEIYARDTRSEGEDLTLFEPFPSPATPVWVESSDPFRANDLYVSGSLGEFTLNGMASSRDQQEFYVVGYVDNLSNARDTRTDFVNLAWRHPFAGQLTLEGRVYQIDRELDIRAAVSLVPYFVLSGETSERELGTQYPVDIAGRLWAVALAGRLGMA